MGRRRQKERRVGNSHRYWLGNHLLLVSYTLLLYQFNTYERIAIQISGNQQSHFIFFFLFSVGVFKNGRVEIIANDQGNRITPSYVAFTAEGERLIGDAAKNQLTTNPENTVFDAKRMIGREWSDSAVQHDLKYFPFKVVDKNSKPHITLTTSTGDQSFAAEEISAMVLVKMKETAEAYLGKKVTHAVVTVPAVSCNVDYSLRFRSMRLFCDI